MKYNKNFLFVCFFYFPKMKKWEMKMGFNSFFAELHFARGVASIRQQGYRVVVIENHSSASVAPV